MRLVLDAFVFFLQCGCSYEPRNGLGGSLTFRGPPSWQLEVVSRCQPIPEIWRDTHVAELFIEDRVTRRSTLHLLKTIAVQLEQLLGSDALARCRLPSNVHVRSVEPGERRVTVSGVDFIASTGNRTAQRVMPSDFDCRSLLVVHHVVDRCSTNCAGLHFLQAQNFAMIATFGALHDDWNACKTAAKRTDGWWPEIIKFAAVANLSKGPFRSGAWGKALQQTLHEYVSTRTSEDSGFRAAVRRQQELDGGNPDASDAAFAQWWSTFSKLRSAHESGPACKFSRWCSIQDSWDFYKGDLYLLKEVLEHMTPEAATDSLHRTEDVAAGLRLNEVAAAMSCSKEGLLKRCPRHITQRLTDVMQMFCCCTSAFREQYTFRTVEVKTIDDSCCLYANFQKGGWIRPLRAMVAHTLYNADVLRKIGVWNAHDERASRSAREMAAMVVNMFYENCIRQAGQALQPPLGFINMCATPGRAVANRTVHAQDYARLLDAEQKAACGDADLAAVVQDVVWRSWALPRLMFEVCRKEQVTHPHSNGPESRHLLRALFRKLGDEKGAEDLHQHIRDLSRCRRSKVVGLVSAFSAILRSGVVEARTETTSAMPLAAVAAKAWRSMERREKTRHLFKSAPASWPPELTPLLLNKTRAWPSPTVPTYCESMLAWQRIRTCATGRHAAASWWGRLLPRKSVVVTTSDGQSFIPLFPGRWAVLALMVDTLGEDSWAIHPQNACVRIVYITASGDAMQWPQVTPVEGVPVDDVGICFRGTAPGQWFLRDTLSRRQELTTWELDKALSTLQMGGDADDSPPITHEAKLKKLAHIVFHGQAEEAERVLALYASPAKPTDDPSADTLDPDLVPLLEELAVSDQANATEFKEWRREEHAKHVRRFNAARAKALAAKRRRGRRVREPRLRPRPKRQPRDAAAAVEPGSVPAEHAPKRPRSSATGASACSAADLGALHTIEADSANIISAADPVVRSADSGAAVGMAEAYAVVPRPAAATGWAIVECEGGWLKFNPDAGNGGRLDGHCGQHNDCSCNRVMSKGVIGLQLAWLSYKCDCKEQHEFMKCVLSASDMAQERAEKRAQFLAVAAESPDGVHAQIAKHELRLRGSNDEPSWIACPPPRGLSASK